TYRIQSDAERSLDLVDLLGERGARVVRGERGRDGYEDGGAGVDSFGPRARRGRAASTLGAQAREQRGEQLVDRGAQIRGQCPVDGELDGLAAAGLRDAQAVEQRAEARRHPRPL